MPKIRSAILSCAILMLSAAIPLSAARIYTSRADLSTTQGPGIGYQKGYSTVSMFLMPSKWECDSFFPFLDLRLHGFNDLKLAMNAGVGARYLTSSSRILGINAYYDNRQGKHRGLNKVGNCFNQVGIGIESLGPTFDFRANYYQPVGKKLWKFQQITFNDQAGLIPIIHRREQYTMTGFNAEIGGTIGRWNICDCFDWSSYLAAGPYYLEQEVGTGRWGGQARLTSIFARYYLLEFRGSYDHVTKGTFQVKVGVTIPLCPQSSVKGKSSCPEECFTSSIWASLREMISQPVVRAEIMPLESCKRH